MDHGLSIRSLVKKYRGCTAVGGVTFDVREGSITGLLGPNGSGKSSVLHVVTGVVSPTSGSVRVFDRDHRSRAAKAMIGFAPDDLALPMNLTGIEYLDLVRRLQPSYDARLAEQLADSLSISPGLRRLVSEYSHGMKRKLQIVAAVAHRPRLLVLDEPYRGLDPATGICLQKIVSTFVEQGGSVLIATHDLRAAESYCDDVVIMADGGVMAHGATGDLLAGSGSTTLEGLFLEKTGLDLQTRDCFRRLAVLDLMLSRDVGA